MFETACIALPAVYTIVFFFGLRCNYMFRNDYVSAGVVILALVIATMAKIRTALGGDRSTLSTSNKVLLQMICFYGMLDAVTYA
jgi:hypothetical protein